MVCQVCGTVDDRDKLGPVKVFELTDEGLCQECVAWVYAVKWEVFMRDYKESVCQKEDFPL